MGNLENFLAGVKILEEINSPINGKLVVRKDFAWGTYIQGGGVTQSGGVAKLVWQKALNFLEGKNIPVENCLILGLGGGSIVQIIRKIWPKANITGVDIDPVIVDLGKRYLKLTKTNAKIVIQDSLEFCVNNKNHYSLVCVDMYCGNNVPAKFTNLNFVKLISKLTNKRGVVIFNRLYSSSKRKEADDFLKILEKVFSKVEPIFPEANVLYICTKQMPLDN